MKIKSLNTKGFGAVEVLLVLVVLVLVAAGGFYIYHKDHKAKAPVSSGTKTNSTSQSSKTSTSNKTASTAGPYAGWLTASLKYEQATFKYPSSWQISNTSKDETETGGVANPGADTVTLTSPTGQIVSIETGQPYTVDDAGMADVLPGGQSIQTLGNTYYLDFYSFTNGSSTASSNDASGACLDKSATTNNEAPYIASKNITLAAASPAADLVCVQYENAQRGLVAKPVSDFEQDASYNDAKLIIESLSY